MLRQRAVPPDALAGHVHRHLALGRDQQGFIADLAGHSMSGQHGAWQSGGGRSRAISRRGAALALQVSHECHHHRGLPDPPAITLPTTMTGLPGCWGTERAIL